MTKKYKDKHTFMFIYFIFFRIIRREKIANSGFIYYFKLFFFHNKKRSLTFILKEKLFKC